MSVWHTHRNRKTKPECIASQIECALHQPHSLSLSLFLMALPILTVGWLAGWLVRPIIIASQKPICAEVRTHARPVWHAGF